MAFQSAINKAITTIGGMSAIGKHLKQQSEANKAERATAKEAITSQLQSLSQRIDEMEKAKQTKTTARKWLDNILGGGEIG